MIDANSELKRGLLWFGSATLLTRLLDFGATLVLLRVLSKKEMGIAALSWSVVLVCEALNGLGIGTALVQAKELSRRELDSLFWFASGVGVLLAGLMAASAPLIAAVYGEPALTPMVIVSAVKLVFVGVALVPLQLLSRDLRFRGAGAVQTGASALDVVTKVALALSGAGAWSLVISNTARGLYVLVMVYLLAPYWPALRFRFAEIRSFVAYGLRTIVSAVIYQAYRNADYFLVGRYLGLEMLGVYRVGFSLAMTPLEVVVQVANRVGFPVYARVANDLPMRAEALARSLRHVLLLAGPIVVVLYFAAPDAVALVGHERWLPAVPVIQILVWASLLRAISQIFPTFFQAIGRPEYAVYDAALNAVLLVTGFWVVLAIYGQRFGMLAVCWVWLAVNPALAVIEMYWAKRAAQIAPRALLRAALPVFPGLFAMTLALALIPWQVLRAHGMPAAGMVGVAVLIGVGVYVLYLRLVLGLRPRDLSARSAHVSQGPATQAPREGDGG